MTNALFSWVNRIDASALTPSGEAGDLSASNLATHDLGRRWRTTDPNGHCTADFGSAVAIGVLALVFPRDTMGGLAGTVRHRLDAVAAGGGAAYDSGAVAIGQAQGYGYHVHVLPSPVSARYWRWDYAAAGVPYVDTGRAWAGEAWVPDRNFSYGDADEWADLSVTLRSPRSGVRFSDRRDRFRRMVLALDAMSEADRLAAREMRRIAGTSEQVLLVKFPAAPARETILGAFRETSPIAHASFQLHASAFQIEEDL